MHRMQRDGLLTTANTPTDSWQPKRGSNVTLPCTAAAADAATAVNAIPRHTCEIPGFNRANSSPNESARSSQRLKPSCIADFSQ